MGTIKDLPGAGSKFSVNIGPGSFKNKFRGVTRYGQFRNLDPHRDVILNAIKKYEGVIRRNDLSSQRSKYILKSIKTEDKGVTKDDQKDIKEILKHLERNKVAPVKVEKEGVLRSNMALDRPDFMKTKEEERITYAKKILRGKENRSDDDIKDRIHQYKEQPIEHRVSAGQQVSATGFAKENSSKKTSLVKPDTSVISISSINKK